MPSVSVEGGAFEGIVAFRRPSEWSRRLDDPAGFGGRDEETFVASWGRLPDDPLTLAGALGFRGAAEAEVDARPVPLRRSVRTDMRIDLGEGRLDLAVDAVVRDLSGQSTDLDVGLPPGLVPDRVAADGLVGLSWPAPDRVHLELARVAGGARKVTIRGHSLVDPDSALVESRHYRATAPRLRWSDATEEAAALTLVAVSRPSAEPIPGAPAVSPVESSAVGPAPGPRTYRVERAGDVAAIRWQAAPPRVGVFVQSRLVVGEDAVGLDATIRYEVAGGPLDVIYLRAPHRLGRGRSRAARRRHVPADDRGPRGLDDLDDPPRPSDLGDGPPPGRIAPRDRGGGLVRLPRPHPARPGAGGEDPLGPERTTGAAIEPSKDRPGSRPSTRPGSTRTGRAHRPPRGSESIGWSGESWSLTIRPGGSAGAPTPAGQVAVREAETLCGLRPDGVAIGATTYLVDALGSGVPSASGSDRGPRCSRHRPGAGRCRSSRRATANGRSRSMRPGPSRSTSSGDPVRSGATARGARSSCPVSNRRACRPSSGSRRPNRWSSAPSRRDSSRYPGPPGGSSAPERLARRALALIGDFDRSSTSEEAALTGLLSRFALEARLANRSASGEPDGLGEPLVRRLDRARSSVAESLDLYGLDDFRPALDNGPTPDDRDVPPAPRPLPLGRSTSFRSTSASAPDREEAISWELRPSPASTTAETAWPWWGLAATVAVILPRMLGLPGFRSRAVGIVVALALVCVAVIAPIPGLFLFLAAWVGRA